MKFNSKMFGAYALAMAVLFVILFFEVAFSPAKVTHNAYFVDKDFYENAYASADLKTPELAKVYGGILPHHLLPKSVIAGFYNALSTQDVDTVVLIGPNHYGVGYGNIITSKATWLTPYGTLEPNTNAIDYLVENFASNVNELPFDDEHSISSHVAFIKKTWPDANFVPIILRYGASTEEVTQLAESLNNILGSKTLVLASVDFSHYQPTWVSNFHDELSENVIETFDFNRIYNLEIDSPPSIYTLLYYLEKRGAKNTITFAHTNSGTFADNLKNSENTSHIFDYFIEGEKNVEGVTSILLTPKNKEEEIDLLGGVEGQFFRGIDSIQEWDESLGLNELKPIFDYSNNVMVGVTFHSNQTNYYLIPYSVVNRQPKLMEENEREEFLLDLAKNSLVDESLKKDIQSGAFTINFNPNL